MAENKTYTAIINDAIVSFNKIFNTMVKKGSLLSADQIARKEGHLIPTLNYGDLVDRLTYISSTVDGFIAPNSIVDFTNKSTTLQGVSNLYDETDNYKLAIEGRALEAGYYTNGATDGTKITIKLDTAPVTFATTSQKVTINYKTQGVSSSGIKSYTYLPADGEIIRSFEVGAGSATSEIKSAKHVITAQNTLDSSMDASNFGAKEVLFEKGLSESKAGYKELTVSFSSAVTGTASATATTTYTKGYIDSDATVDSEASVKTFGTETGNINLNQTGNATIFIKEGSIALAIKENEKAEATITSDDTTYKDILFTEVPSEGIAIDAAVGALPLEATVTPGYVAGGDSIDTDAVSVESSTKYIKKGSVGAQSIDVQFGTVVDSSTILVPEGTAGAYAVTVPVAANTTKKTAETGFIRKEDAGNITLSGSKTVYVGAGKVDVEAKIESYALSTEGSIAATKTAVEEDDYEIILTPNLKADATKTVKKGLVTASDVTVAVNKDSLASLSAFVKKAKVTAETGLVITPTAVDVTTDPGKVETTSVGALFRDTAAGITGDYFELVASYSHTVGAGYTEGMTIQGTSTKYMPKAVFEWVQSEDGKDEYLQVKTGGYLPSGRITQIASVEENNAVVTLGAASENMSIILAKDKVSKTKYYDFKINYNVDAGYISETTENAVLNVDYSVAAGSIAVEAGAEFDSLGTITRVADEAGKVEYEVPVNVTAKSGLSYNVGYIKADDVNVAKQEQSVELTAKLGQATLDTVEHSTSVSLSSDTVRAAAADEDSAFIITPSIDGCTTTLKFNAGYISASAEDTIVHNVGEHGISNAATAVYKVHAGNNDLAKIELGSNTLGIAAISNKKIVEAAANGVYTLSLEGNITATATLVDEGYYAENANFQRTNAITAKTFEIKQGSVTPSGIAVVDTKKVKVGEEEVEKKGIYSTEAVLYNTNTATGKTFIELNVEAAISSSATIGEGYIKEDDLGADATSTYRDAKYLETYEVVEHSVGQLAGYTIPEDEVEANEKIVIPTAGKYLKSDIEVELSDNAMGKAVVNQMALLEARLNGIW